MVGTLLVKIINIDISQYSTESDREIIVTYETGERRRAFKERNHPTFRKMGDILSSVYKDIRSLTRYNKEKHLLINENELYQDPSGR